MTLNITKKKIEKVLELFNHPQTRKIRKNRGKKRRRNNKSFNRKNGRKNLATSTLKKRGGQAGHPILNGGTVGVVLGGQVGGDMNRFKKWFSTNKEEIGKEHDKQKENPNFFNNLYVRYKTWKEKRQQERRKTPYTVSDENEAINNSDDYVSVQDLFKIILPEEEEIQISQEEKKLIQEYPFIKEIEKYKMVAKIDEPDEDKTMENFYPNGGKFKANLKKDFNELKTSINPFTLDVSPYDTQYNLQRPITLTINDKPYELNVTENDFNKYFEILDIIKESNSETGIETERDNQNSDIKQEEQGAAITNLSTTGQQEKQEQNSKSAEKVEQPKEESKNDKMMKLLTLREDYTIFNILNNLLPPKEEGQTADLKEIVKKLDFGKFVDEIGILKNDEEEEEGEVDGDNDNEEVK